MDSGQMTYLLAMFTSLINSLELEQEVKRELIKGAEQELCGNLAKVCLDIMNVAKPDNLMDCLKKLGDHITSYGVLMDIAGEEVGGNTRLAGQFSQAERGALIDIVLKGGEGSVFVATSTLFSVAVAFNFENQSKLVDAFLKTLPMVFLAGMASPGRIDACNRMLWKNLNPSLRQKIHQKLIELASEDSEENSEGTPAKPSKSN